MKNRIKIFIVILFSFTNIIIVNAQWTECNNCPECYAGIINVDAIWCFAIDGNNTYTGITGGVYVTTNNGDNWTPKNKGLNSVHEKNVLSLAIDGNNIFAGTMIDGIFLSTDKGENWVRRSNGLPTLINVDTIYTTIIKDLKIIGNNVYAGTNHGVYLSTDNGENWISKNNGLPQKYDSILNETIINVESLAGSGNNVYAGTWYGVYSTIDNGDNWVAKNKDMENLVVQTLATSGNNIYAGGYGTLLLSTDNGDNWKKINDSSVVSSIIIKGNNIFTNGYGINWTSDNGNSWKSNNSGLPDLGLGIMSMIINGDYIFVGIDNDGIYRAKLSDLGITDVKETEQKIETIIYPNPASSEIKLKFESTDISKIQISIFDLLGKEVFSSYEDCNIGMNEKVIDCRSLGTGYYIIRLKQNDKVEAKPFVVLR